MHQQIGLYEYYRTPRLFQIHMQVAMFQNNDDLRIQHAYLCFGTNDEQDLRE